MYNIEKCQTYLKNLALLIPQSTNGFKSLIATFYSTSGFNSTLH